MWHWGALVAVMAMVVSGRHAVSEHSVSTLRRETAEALGTAGLLGLQAVPPAEFHTRCMTFLNAVISEASGEPARVQEIMEHRCGGDAQSVLHRGVSSALARRCRDLGARLVAHMQRAEAGQESDGDSRRLVSSSWNPPRVHRFYQAAAAWCYDVYGAHESHSWDRLATPASRRQHQNTETAGPTRRNTGGHHRHIGGAARAGTQGAWVFSIAAVLLVWRG